MKQIVDKLNKIAKKIDESVEIPQTDLIIDSLDAITKAYGGTPNDSNLIVDKLEDIYNNIGSGGGGGDSMLKTTLTIVNNTDHLITMLPIEMRLDYVLLNNNVVNVPINAEGAIILEGNNIPEIELHSGQTMVLDLYYCVAVGSTPNTGIKFASTDTYTASNVVNFTYNSDADAYLVTDLTIGSSITVTIA